MLYTLTRDNQPTSLTGDSTKVRAFLDWNDIISPTVSWNMVAIEGTDTPTGQGVDFDCPPQGPLVQAMFGHALQKGFNLTYSKDIWRDVLFILKFSPGTRFLWARNAHSTRILALNWDANKAIHWPQEVVDYRKGLDYFEHCVIEAGFNQCAMIETTDIVGPISGCITPLPVDGLKPFLDGHQAALPPMPDLARDESVLEIDPGHQEFFSELWAKAEALGAGAALERAMQRCINYADNRVDYKCVLAPSSDEMSFTAQPMTKGRETKRWEWDRIIFFGVIYDREAKEWRFHS